MFQRSTRIGTAALAAIALIPAAFAQGPGGGQGGFGGPGGGPGGFGGGRPPFAMGAVTAVDTTAHTITISSQFGQQQQTVISVPDTVKVSAQVAAKVADLKVGDQVRVSGVPTAMTAQTLSIGDLPAGFPGAPRPGGQGGGGQNGAGQNGGGQRGGGQGGPPPAPPISAKVTKTDPLTLEINPGASLVLTMAADAKVTKIADETLDQVKVGDQVMAMGQAGDNGAFAATSVAVNMNQGMMGGRGGFGRGGGMGGFGGGQGGFGGGGFGGGQGGFGRRNQGGGQGGFNQGGGQGGPGGGGPGGGGPGGFGGPPPPDGQGGPGMPPPPDGGQGGQGMPPAPGNDNNQ